MISCFGTIGGKRDTARRVASGYNAIKRRVGTPARSTYLLQYMANHAIYTIHMGKVGRCGAGPAECWVERDDVCEHRHADAICDWTWRDEVVVVLAVIQRLRRERHAAHGGASRVIR